MAKSQGRSWSARRDRQHAACVLLSRKRAYLVLIVGERCGEMVVSRLEMLRDVGHIWHLAGSQH
jgi:hypothetical protein